MIRVWLSLMAGASLALLSGCSPEPCTSCLTVDGAFSESSRHSSVDCRDGLILLQDDYSGLVGLQQSGSILTLNGPLGMPGVLHKDLSASFGPVSATAMPIDGAGNPDPNGLPAPGKVFLEGWFQSENGRAVLFKGTYMFIADADGCEVDSTTQWSR